MFQTILSRGIISLTGGFFIALVIGVPYIWGIISIYITSYFRIVDQTSPDLTYQTTAMVFPIMIFGLGIAMPLGVRIMKKANAKKCCVIGGVIFGLIVYISSYITSFTIFTLIYGIGAGLVIGFIYMIPIAHGYKYFPKKKGTVSGIIIAGSGFGTFVFGIVAIKVINPFNVPVQKDYYNADIAMNIPQFIRNLGLICAVSIVGGAFLLLDLLPGMDPYASHKNQQKQQNKPKLLVELMQNQFTIPNDEQQQDKSKKIFSQKNLNNHQRFWSWQENGYPHEYLNQQYGYVSPNKYKSMRNIQLKTFGNTKNQNIPEQVNFLNECPRVRDAPTVKIFWIIFSLTIFGANFGLLMSGSYKSYAKKYIKDDKFLTIIGAVGSMFNGLSRLFWAAMLDRFEFKCLYTGLLITNGLLALTVSYAVHIPQIYLIYVGLTYTCYGGHIGMFPAITSQVFGVRNGTQIYGLIFLGFGFSNTLQFIFLKTIKIKYGYNTIFYIQVIFSAIAMYIVNSFQFYYDWRQKMKQNAQRKRLAAF